MSYVTPDFEKIEEIAYALLDKRESRTFHCAVIFRRKKILSIGTNSYKTHPYNRRFGYKYDHVHAELSAVIKLGRIDCSGLGMAVLRIDMNNKLNLSQPCFHCAAMCKSVNFSNVFYTNAAGLWVRNEEF